MKIFVDMDGVITDFVGGVCDLVGYSGQWPAGEYDLNKVMNRNVWPFLERKGITFWTDLKKTEEADAIMTMVERHDYYICTSPSLDPMSAAGKMIWLNAQYPQVMKDRRFFITPHKHLLASEHSILLDDSDDQITKWHNAGGVGMLIPRPWNKALGNAEFLPTLRGVLELLTW